MSSSTTHSHCIHCSSTRRQKWALSRWSQWESAFHKHALQRQRLWMPWKRSLVEHAEPMGLGEALAQAKEEANSTWTFDVNSNWSERHVLPVGKDENQRVNWDLVEAKERQSAMMIEALKLKMLCSVEFLKFSKLKISEKFTFWQFVAQVRLETQNKRPFIRENDCPRRGH